MCQRALELRIVDPSRAPIRKDLTAVGISLAPIGSSIVTTIAVSRFGYGARSTTRW